eukprot:4052722-Pyramimonas_sp.AAC.1
MFERGLYLAYTRYFPTLVSNGMMRAGRKLDAYARLEGAFKFEHPSDIKSSPVTRRISEMPGQKTKFGKQDKQEDEEYEKYAMDGKDEKDESDEPPEEVKVNAPLKSTKSFCPGEKKKTAKRQTK